MRKYWGFHSDCHLTDNKAFPWRVNAAFSNSHCTWCSSNPSCSHPIVDHWEQKPAPILWCPHGTNSNKGPYDPSVLARLYYPTVLSQSILLNKPSFRVINDQYLRNRTIWIKTAIWSMFSIELLPRRRFRPKWGAKRTAASGRPLDNKWSP